MKTEFGVYPNQPRRLADEVIAHFIFGWRWLPYQTSRQRQCWVFCPPSTQKIYNLPADQISGPTSAQECELQPAMERVAYDSLPKFSEWLRGGQPMTLAELAKSRRTPSAVRKALRWVDDYLKECPASLTRQGWHDSAPTLIIPGRKGFHVLRAASGAYETGALFCRSRKAALNSVNGDTAVDEYNKNLVRKQHREER